MMTTQSKEYCTKGSSRHLARDTETADFSFDISDIVLGYFGVLQWVSANHLLYKSDQFICGDPVDRADLNKVMKSLLQL